MIDRSYASPASSEQVRLIAMANPVRISDLRTETHDQRAVRATTVADTGQQFLHQGDFWGTMAALSGTLMLACLVVLTLPGLMNHRRQRVA